MISSETNYCDLTELDHGSRQHIFSTPKFAKIARDSIQRSNPPVPATRVETRRILAPLPLAGASIVTSPPAFGRQTYIPGFAGVAWLSSARGKIRIAFALASPGWAFMSRRWTILVPMEPIASKAVFLSYASHEAEATRR